jgi:hypothetical protein
MNILIEATNVLSLLVAVVCGNDMLNITIRRRRHEFCATLAMNLDWRLVRNPFTTLREERIDKPIEGHPI